MNNLRKLHFYEKTGEKRCNFCNNAIDKLQNLCYNIPIIENGYEYI